MITFRIIYGFFEVTPKHFELLYFTSERTSVLSQKQIYSHVRSNLQTWKACLAENSAFTKTGFPKNTGIVDQLKTLMFKAQPTSCSACKMKICVWNFLHSGNVQLFNFQFAFEIGQTDLFGPTRNNLSFSTVFSAA